MGRQLSKQAVTITDSLLTTERIPFSDRAGGNVLIPANSFDGSVITFYAATEPDGDLGVVHKAAGDGTTVSFTFSDTGVDCVFPIPIECFGAAEIAILGDNATPCVSQVSLKD